MITIILATVAVLTSYATVRAVRSDRVASSFIASTIVVCVAPAVIVGASAFAIASLFTPLS